MKGVGDGLVLVNILQTDLSAFQPVVDILASVLKLRYLPGYCGEVLLECGKECFEVV